VWHIYISGIYGIFFCIFTAYATLSDRVIIMIINRPILHTFDIFNLIYSMTNCKYLESFAAKTI